MDRQGSVPDGLAGHVEAFAESHGIGVERAYELLVSVGLEALDGLHVTVSVEGDRLVLDCPRCGAVFDPPAEARDHDCGDV